MNKNGCDGRGSLQADLDVTEWRRLAELYDLERYLFESVSPRFRRDGTLNARGFFAIIVWKSNRTKTKIAKGLRHAGTMPEELLHRVSAEGDRLRQVQILTSVKGIGLPMASAILTVCYPDEFTVLDYRAWKTLRQMSVPGLPAGKPTSARAYLQYCEACRQLAKRVGVSLRDLDRALSAKSWEEDLINLIEREVP